MYLRYNISSPFTFIIELSGSTNIPLSLTTTPSTSINPFLAKDFTSFLLPYPKLEIILSNLSIIYTPIHYLFTSSNLFTSKMILLSRYNSIYFIIVLHIVTYKIHLFSNAKRLNQNNNLILI